MLKRFKIEGVAEVTGVSVIFPIVFVHFSSNRPNILPNDDRVRLAERAIKIVSEDRYIGDVKEPLKVGDMRFMGVLNQNGDLMFRKSGTLQINGLLVELSSGHILRLCSCIYPPNSCDGWVSIEYLAMNQPIIATRSASVELESNIIQELRDYCVAFLALVPSPDSYHYTDLVLVEDDILPEKLTLRYPHK